jgi:uncharacterized protein YndB with AHSA1/START domain
MGGAMTNVGSEATTVAHPGGAFALDVSRAVAAPLGRVWQVLVSREGASGWLGEGAELGGKGEPYHCSDGTSGVVRSYHPLEQLRVSWHATPDSPPSVVEIDLRADGDATIVDLRHERIADEHLLDPLRLRWAAGLDALADRATG